MEMKSFARGDVVMSQGDASDDKLYVILDGRATIVVNFNGKKPPPNAIYDISLLYVRSFHTQTNKQI